MNCIFRCCIHYTETVFLCTIQAVSLHHLPVLCAPLLRPDGTIPDGVFNLCNDVPRHIVEEAAQTCIDASACKYSYFKKALSRLMNHEQASGDTRGRLPEHENIRGRDSYK